MAYDRRTHKAVLFGGYNGRQDLGDTWLWDGTTSTWTQVTPGHSPTAVTGPMVFTDPNGRVDEFGGFDGQLYEGRMWQWMAPIGKSCIPLCFLMLALRQRLASTLMPSE